MTSEAQRIYREIYEQNAGRIYGYIFRKICDSASAEDLKQEVFVALLFNLAEFVPDYPENEKRIKTWLFGVADNKIKLYWRENHKRFDMEVSFEHLESLKDLQDMLSVAEYTLPDWLKPKDKEILMLRLSGYSLKEISGRLGLSYEACRQRNARITRTLGEFCRK